MDEKKAQYFMTVARTGSLTKAAELLRISQPSLSKYLSRLEKDLGIILVDRTHVPLRLTYAGKKYREYLEETMRLDRKLKDDFSKICKEEMGEFTFALSTWRSGLLMPLILPQFRERHPGINAKVVEGQSQNFENILVNRQADFGIMTVPANFFQTEMEHELLYREKVYLLGNNDHPLVKEALQNPPGENGVRRFDIRKLSGQKFINMKKGQILSLTNNDFFRQHKIEFGEIWYSESLITAINMIGTSRYFTMMPDMFVKTDHVPKNVSYFEIGEPAYDWEVAVAYPKGETLTSIMRLFIKELREAMNLDDPS